MVDPTQRRRDIRSVGGPRAISAVTRSAPAFVALLHSQSAEDL